MNLTVKIGLIHDIVRLEEKLILEAAQSLGVRITRFFVKKASINLNNNEELFDIGLQRSLSHSLAIESTHSLEASGHRVINGSFTLASSLDKVHTLSLLRRTNIPVPETFTAFSLEGALNAASKLQYPVVVKPINGSWGALVSMARDEEELRTIIEHRLRIPGIDSRVHIIQEYVRKPGRDIRVTVIGEEVIASIYRVSNHWITNTSRGGRALSFEPDQELQELCLRVREVMKGEFLGIDVFEHPDKGNVVNEVNAVPEFKNVQRVTGIDVAKALVRYAVKEAVK